MLSVEYFDRLFELLESPAHIATEVCFVLREEGGGRGERKSHIATEV